MLGLDPYDGTPIDKKVIKKAFRQLAIKYHPDAITNKDSSAYDKKWAAEQFAKINLAYGELLNQIHTTGRIIPPLRNGGVGFGSPMSSTFRQHPPPHHHHHHAGGPSRPGNENSGGHKNMRRPSTRRRKSVYPDNWTAQTSPNSNFYSSVSSAPYPGDDEFWAGTKNHNNNWKDPKYHYNPTKAYPKNPFGEYWKNTKTTISEDVGSSGSGSSNDASFFTEYNDYGPNASPFGGQWVGSRGLDPRHSYGHNNPYDPDSLDQEVNETIFHDFFSGEEQTAKYEYKPKEYPHRDLSSPSRTQFNDFTQQVSTEAYGEGSAAGEETIFTDFYSGEPENTSSTSSTSGSDTLDPKVTASGPETVFEDFLSGAYTGESSESDVDKVSSKIAAERGASIDTESGVAAATTAAEAEAATESTTEDTPLEGGATSLHSNSGFSGGAVANQGSLFEAGAFNGGTINIGKTAVQEAQRKAQATHDAFLNAAFNGGTGGVSKSSADAVVATSESAEPKTEISMASIANGATDVSNPASADFTSQSVSAGGVNKATFSFSDGSSFHAGTGVSASPVQINGDTILDQAEPMEVKMGTIHVAAESMGADLGPIETNDQFFSKKPKVQGAKDFHSAESIGSDSSSATITTGPGTSPDGTPGRKDSTKTTMNGIPYAGTFSGGTVTSGTTPDSHVTATSGVSIGSGTGISTKSPALHREYDGPETIINDFYSGEQSNSESGHTERPNPNDAFRDLVDLLKSNSNTCLASVARQVNDADLTALLETGSMDQIGSEMADTELVVKQLASKLLDLEHEIEDILSELDMNTKYANKIALEQLEAECVARKTVVEKFLPKAQERLFLLQYRYQELGVEQAHQHAHSQPQRPWQPSQKSSVTNQPSRTLRREADDDEPTTCASTVFPRPPSTPFTAPSARHSHAGSNDEVLEIHAVDISSPQRRQDAAARRRERIKNIQTMQPDFTWTATNRQVGG